MKTNPADYQTWCTHYGYADTEHARADYKSYVDNLELVVRLFG